MLYRVVSCELLAVWFVLKIKGPRDTMSAFASAQGGTGAASGPAPVEGQSLQARLAPAQAAGQIIAHSTGTTQSAPQVAAKTATSRSSSGTLSFLTKTASSGLQSLRSASVVGVTAATTSAGMLTRWGRDLRDFILQGECRTSERAGFSLT